MWQFKGQVNFYSQCKTMKIINCIETKYTKWAQPGILLILITSFQFQTLKLFKCKKIEQLILKRPTVFFLKEQKELCIEMDLLKSKSAVSARRNQERSFMFHPTILLLQVLTFLNKLTIRQKSNRVKETIFFGKFMRKTKECLEDCRARKRQEEYELKTCRSIRYNRRN